MEKVELQDGQSTDIVKDNIEKLKDIFPEAFAEGKVNFDTLKQLLGDKKVIEEGEEKFGLNWHGKKRALQIGLTPSAGTLLPCPEESVDWDTTKNIFIEGDNLETLKLLQKSYANKVKMIYIDPPYNTESDFIYPDKYKEGLDTYLFYTGQKDKNGEWTTSNKEKTGRKHTNWLNMILPRIKLAKSLLSKDGIFVSHVDEHEFTNLNCILEELFGAENNLGPIIWDKKNPKGDSTKIAVQHEYLLIYAKDYDFLKSISELKRSKENAKAMLSKAKNIFNKLNQSYDLDDVNKEYRDWLKKQNVSGGEAAYKYIDSKGFIYRTVSMAWPNKQEAPAEYFIPLKHPVTDVNCPVPERGWRNPLKTMNELLAKNLIIFGESELKQPERKYFLHENMKENIPSVLPFGGSDDALLKNLGIPFDNPKPVKFCKNIINYFTGDNSIILDFFAGSSTTAHACYELNKELGSNHKFIMIQLPEKLDLKKKEQKAAYTFCIKSDLDTNISEVSKERIRRAAIKIKEENPDYKGDLGFKVFKLAQSNIKAWNPDKADIEETLEQNVEHIILGRTEQDVLFELLLKRGVDLTTPIENRKVNDKTVYSIGYGVLFACLDKSIDRDDVEDLSLGIIEWYKELKPDTDSHVFFLDSAFTDDVVKTNMAAILEQNGIKHVKSL